MSENFWEEWDQEDFTEEERAFVQEVDARAREKMRAADFHRRLMTAASKIDLFPEASAQSQGRTRGFSQDEITEQPQNDEIIGQHKKIIAARGDESLELIRETNYSIIAVHFTSEIPTQRCISLMVERLKQVRIERLVARRPDQPKETYRWLDQFREHGDEHGEPLPNYTEYEYQGKPSIQDFMIFDDQKVLQFLPTHAEADAPDRAVLFDDPEIASWFRNLFLFLLPSDKDETRKLMQEQNHQDS